MPMDHPTPPPEPLRPQDHRQAYDRRMHRVLQAIDQQLDAPLALPALAAVANFSPFHFHRLFSAWMGETLGDYLRRRRVEVAALRLATQPQLSVLQAALSVGFGSGEAFARAFKARYGAAPSVWRARQGVAQGTAEGTRLGASPGADSNPGQVLRNPGQALAAACPDHGGSSHNPPEDALDVSLTDLAPVTVAYLRHTGAYGEPIQRFWLRTVSPWLAARGLQDHPRYGICHDDPGVTAARQCRYDACAEVPAGFQPPRNTLLATLPGGRYAVLRYAGQAPGISDAWNRVLRDWLPASGLQLDNRPSFEQYLPGDWDGSGSLRCNICIAVTPL